ncbi:MAG: type 1 glutamine amidotransferase [Devosia sp.]|nr:type 1 glutamine amidotransferase [Devosia sp.]
MKLTILLTGNVPVPLRAEFGPYPLMFERMFARVGETFSYDVVAINEGAPFPDPATLDAVLVPGSAAGVYDDLPWLEPLRHFIRTAYAGNTPMLGICFGHQIMADALGGDVRKSEKGWGLGRHTYGVIARPNYMTAAPASLSVACSHQDQVIVAPPEAETFLASAFTPNAGLNYRNGAAISLQSHPEFDDDYTLALARLRTGKAPQEVIDLALESVQIASDSTMVAGYLGAFLRGVR